MFFLIIMNIIWAASYSFQKWGLFYMAPMHMLFARTAIACFLLFLISFRLLKGMDRKTIMRCALIGLVIAIAHGLGNIGIEKSHATDGALLYALEPIIAIVYARILLGERMDGPRKFALLLAIVGFAILSDIQSGNLFRNMTFVGNLIMFVGTFADGAFSAIAKPAVEKYPARAVMTVAFFFTTIFILPFALQTEVRPTTFSWQSAVSLFYLAVICTTIGWTFWVHLLKRYPVNVIALTIFTQPVLGPIVSHFTLGEEIGARVWFGGSIILIAVAITVLGRKQGGVEIISEAIVR